MSRQGEGGQFYQLLHVDGDTLRYESRTALGVVYDAFLLRKRPGQVNELVERIPNTPELRRAPKKVAASP